MQHSRPPIPPDAAPARDAFETPDFETVPVPHRHDGWTADKQVEFIDALAASGCVDHAARAVGMHPTSAYRLRARPEAASFRAAWEHALEYAVHRLAEATLSRAIHGVVRPVYFQGEVVGERRYFDERLAMFLLRTRDPARYGAWIDTVSAERAPDAEARGLTRAVHRLADDAFADELGHARPRAPIDFPARVLRTQSDIDEERRAAEALIARHDREAHAASMAEFFGPGEQGGGGWEGGT